MPWTRKRRPSPPKPYPAAGVAEVRIDRDLTRAQRDLVFAAIRPTLPAGRGRVVVGPGIVRVQEVPHDRLDLVCAVLDRLAAELAARPARREVA
jgi:hypothetical protein